MTKVVDWKKIPALNREAAPPENLLADMLSELLENDPPTLELAFEPDYPALPDPGLTSSGEIACPAMTISLPEVQASAFWYFSYSPAEIIPQPLVDSREPEVDDLLALLLSAESTGNADPGSNPDRGMESSPAKTEPYSLAGSPINRDSCLVFSLGGEKFGIPIRQVIELDRLPRITPVPNVPAWVRGITNLRGEIVPVLDLGLLLGMGRSERLERGRILVVRIGEDLTAALVADEVDGFANLEQDRLKPYAAGEGGRVIPLLEGIYSTEDLALKVLNMEKLMEGGFK